MFVTKGSAAVIYRLHSTVMELGEREKPASKYAHADIYNFEMCGIPFRISYHEEEMGPEYSRERIYCWIEAPHWCARWHSGMVAGPVLRGSREAMIRDLTMCMLSGELAE